LRFIQSRERLLLQPHRQTCPYRGHDLHANERFEQKMARLIGELSEMFAKSHDLEKQIKKNLEGLGFKM
jgi:hypothetical protein